MLERDTLTDERWATRASLYGRVTSPDGQALSVARWSLWTGKVPNLRRIVNDAGVDDNGIFHYCALRLGDSVVVEVRAKGMANASIPLAVVKQPTVVGVQMRPRRR